MKAVKSVPTLRDIVTEADLAEPEEFAGAHRSAVPETHDVVTHAVEPMRADPVASVVASANPAMVILAPVDVGALKRLRNVTTGESKVNVFTIVPTRPADVTATLNC